MKNIIYEYREVEHKALKEHIVNTSALHKYFKEDWGKVKTRQYCGILNFQDKDFYILPKISDTNEEENLDIFIYMLMYAYDVKLENEDIASCKNEKHNILEVFIQLFAQRLFKEFKRGIYKEYITEQDNLTTLRGKYLINENLKYNHIKNKIYCEYDEFSENNELNQFFLFAVKTLLKYTKNKKLLKHCELVLDEVEYRTFDINNLHVHFNRLNNRFKDSFEFALLLLNKSIPLFAKDKKSFAFLFDMNVLFERFVGKMVKELEPATLLQSCDTYGDLILKPDIIVKDLIIDTKYKKLGAKNDIKRDDKFQMFVYGKNYHITNTMLLYPKHLEHFDYDLVLGEKGEEVKMKVKSLDLWFDGCGGYSEFIEEVKIKVKELSC
ncbi:McrC family protein [Candidatus Sulfurimonas baltica]|uniref:Restriction endonuclease n=1 Tax=Candidatus Sulfurimonas baltica TaxID=2740404 RepID=A0A7S7LWF3_9BACT|nr:restriction endonuclease [Candidatus Sulfurimonas baltica]QOY52779.1 restriction endonuclease [Candidatus Sulfurimonas baltica]